MTYKNSRLKHVKKIKDMCAIMDSRSISPMSREIRTIIDQCNILLETKKKKVKEINCDICFGTGYVYEDDSTTRWPSVQSRCKKCGGGGKIKRKLKSKYSLPNGKEILGMLDGLTIIVRK